MVELRRCLRAWLSPLLACDVRRALHGVARPRSSIRRRSRVGERNGHGWQQLPRAERWRSGCLRGGGRRDFRAARLFATPLLHLCWRSAWICSCPARAAFASLPRRTRCPDASGQLAWAKSRFPPDWVVSVPLPQSGVTEGCSPLGRGEIAEVEFGRKGRGRRRQCRRRLGEDCWAKAPASQPESRLAVETAGFTA